MSSKVDFGSIPWVDPRRGAMEAVKCTRQAASKQRPE